MKLSTTKILAAALLLAAGTQQAFAAETHQGATASSNNAGDTITNTATVQYSIGGVVQVTEPTGQAAFTVDRLIDVTVTSMGDTNVTPGATGKALAFTVTNNTMTEHLHGDRWLNSAANPEISFELGKLSDVKTTDNTTTATATGKFTLKGVTKEITVPVKITYLPDALEKRTRPGNKGDLLVVRSEFTISRKDYGVNPGQMEDKVNDEIAITVAVVGSAPKS